MAVNSSGQLKIDGVRKEKERLTAASFFWPFLVTAVNQSFSFPCLLRGVTVREPLAVGRTFC